jgi:hypothetical protein
MKIMSVLMVAALLGVPMASAAAQGAPMAGAAISAAPVMTNASVGVRRTSEASPLKHPAPFRADTRQNRGLMIVGGAAMLTGMIVGDDAGNLITVGGAVVFLWGLYQYLK